MAYTITQHTKNRAKEHGVKVKPSSKKHKKIDVIKGGEIIASDPSKGGQGTSQGRDCQ